MFQCVSRYVSSEGKYVSQEKGYVSRYISSDQDMFHQRMKTFHPEGKMFQIRFSLGFLMALTYREVQW